MKKKSWTHTVSFGVNTVLALLTLISFLSYYVAPEKAPLIAIFSLFIPALIVLNLLFIVYWILKLHKNVLLSTLVLLIGFQYVGHFYGFEEKKVLLTSDIKVMSYNVRMFNLYEWIDDSETSEHLFEFINDRKPDILCIQEYQPSPDIGFHYPYSYVKISEENRQFGHAIFSNFPIVNKGSIGFENSGNNAIFADLLIDGDTIRVYNVHLESLKVNPAEETLTQDNSERFKKRIVAAFKKQEQQVRKIIAHEETFENNTVLCGDFNNTPFSWSYHQLLGDKNDAYRVAGKGFGSTFDMVFPLRIDFILTDPKFTINHFETFNVKYSDHFPIMARINFKGE